MKTTKLLFATIALCVGLLTAATAQATINFAFDINPTDWSASTGFVAGDKLNISFLDGTDLNNISSSDIFSYKYDIAAGLTGVNYFGAGWASDVGNIGSAFAFDGTHLTFTFDNLGGDYIQSSDSLGYFSQVVTGQEWQLYTSHSNGYSFAYINGNSLVTLTSISPVPEPETYAMLLIGLGLIGFIARRREDFNS